MTAEEVEKYINQIAFSSAEEFVKTYMGKSDSDQQTLIGHFGSLRFIVHIILSCVIFSLSAGSVGRLQLIVLSLHFP